MMFTDFKDAVIAQIRREYDEKFYIGEDEWEEIIDQVSRHFIVHNILFMKDIKFEEFIEGIWRYVSLKRGRV